METSVVKLLNAEFVTLRVEHDDPVLTLLLPLALLRCAKFEKTFDFYADLLLSLLNGYFQTATRVEIKMDPVLPQLRSIHLLEIDPRPSSFRIDNRACGVPLLLGDTPHFQGFFPRLVSVGRVLKLVVECLGVEFRQACRVVTIEDDLYLLGHAALQLSRIYMLQEEPNFNPRHADGISRLRKPSGVSLLNGNYYETVSEIFDSASATYDRDEAGNFIRVMMRALSLHVLRATFRPGQRILEIGCGTGTEAIELAKAGITVVATDISHQMISRVTKRARAHGLDGRIRVHQMAAHDVSMLQSEYGAKSFDGAYSSFGALNCEPNLAEFAASLAALLRTQSRFVCSIINRLCLFDLVLNTFLLKRDPRLGRYPTLNIGNRRLATKYYSPGEFGKMLRPFFVVEGMRALPAVLPPPHFDRHVMIFRSTLRNLLPLEWRLGGLFPFNQFGDHFLATFRKIQ
jgi:ubiquinone/menaquinone biosynthesis C-methylase UbiE